ncbi:alkaline phosphatase family protein [Luteipulveratus mongoliensis]|uniref:Nucleotide pyrophosphatase n=1 Tax=Luteipulveratus mongoliensis TaxID=571913 RepID=A0A0K1JQL0_9MICO|nr:alkaline phosphatase family protein [Luteipulveratus mongoliensis]AKU19009.1 hypothetical protein VV02_16575 [Luteipulveratus mongoliensis]
MSITDKPPPGSEPPLPHSPGPEDLRNGVSTKKVLFLDLDGVRYDTLLAARTPNIDALAKTGQFGPSYLHDNAITGTNSGPGHSNMLTGVWPDKHKVMDNSFDDNNLAAYPDVFTRMEKARPELSTFSTLDWTPLNQFLIGNPDVKMQQNGESTSETDRASTNAAVEALSEHNPDAMYVYLHSGDDAGHTYGDETPQYTTAIENIDGMIGQIISAMTSRTTYRSEDWLVLVATDHGFAGTSHGGDQHSTRTGWVLATGGGIDHCNGTAREWRQVDIAPTILRQLSIEIDLAWGLDGIPIGTPSTESFDTVRTTRGVVDEPAKPAGSGGWSHTLPSGWARTNKVTGGTTEFCGWNLMTGEFWATSQEGQGRGSFVRGRDTIAVADTHEWNRTGSPARAGQTYDSTLWSPWKAVGHDRSLTLSYESHYRQLASGRQKAQVVAQFDNGTSQILWSADAADGDRFDISAHSSLPISVPAGATQVRVGWRLFDAGDNGYWAIDAPRITKG